MDQIQYTPSYLPSQFKEFEGNVLQLGVGKQGKVGMLNVELQKGLRQKTVITRQFSQVPLQVHKALYPEKTLPGMAYLYIMSPSGGILQGDRYRTDIVLKNNAIAHITTQGATRIYSMNSNYASQILNIKVDSGCYLEYVPDQIIPYKNSRYYQKADLSVHHNATMVYSEILAPGRIAMGESFEYDLCYLATRCADQDNKIRFCENSMISPKTQQVKKTAILGKHNIVGTVYVLTKPSNITAIEDTIQQKQTMTRKGQIIFGTSVLPDESGIIVRVLGRSTQGVLNMIHDTIKDVRKKILGGAF